HTGTQSPPPWIPLPYRLDRSICRQLEPSSGTVGAHTLPAHLSSFSFSFSKFFFFNVRFKGFGGAIPTAP
ncbi:MAG: hypothetical protein WBW98_20080, partial [Candidatus Sulfotelmatobacter sp.]